MKAVWGEYNAFDAIELFVRGLTWIKIMDLAHNLKVGSTLDITNTLPFSYN